MGRAHGHCASRCKGLRAAQAAPPALPTPPAASQTKPPPLPGTPARGPCSGEPSGAVPQSFGKSLPLNPELPHASQFERIFRILFRNFLLWSGRAPCRSHHLLFNLRLTRLRADRLHHRRARCEPADTSAAVWRQPGCFYNDLHSKPEAAASLR